MENAALLVSVIKNAIDGIITITDQDTGIPKTDQKHLFELFFRAHNIGNIQGTGLGLNIIARYTQLMNGTIFYNAA